VGYVYEINFIFSFFTSEILKTILKDEGIRMNNKIRAVQPNSSYFIQGKKRKYKVDFINITHSTIQTSLIALHTPKGVVLYANDFKLDDNPIVGKKPNYDKIKEIAKEGVKALVVDSLYSNQEGKTPSERIARYLLEEVMLSTDNKNKGIIVTTFSSHIARLKSIVDFGKKLNRKIVFVGRSLSKYVNASKRIKICPFGNEVTIASYTKQKEAIMKKVNKNKKDYLVVCTGHQGEPGSVLDRISKDQLPLSVNQGDHIIFSSKVIPTPVNLANRENLDKRLKKKGARIFTSAHVSGHAHREDLRDFISMVQPENIIPAHGDLQKLSGMSELASELGYKYGRDCHLMQDGQSIKI
jgi:ribonuclease J